MNKQVRYSPEVRERAVRLVYDNQGDYGSQWAAIVWVMLTSPKRPTLLIVSLKLLEK